MCTITRLIRAWRRLIREDAARRAQDAVDRAHAALPPNTLYADTTPGRTVEISGREFVVMHRAYDKDLRTVTLFVRSQLGGRTAVE